MPDGSDKIVGDGQSSASTGGAGLAGKQKPETKTTRNQINPRIKKNKDQHPGIKRKTRDSMKCTKCHKSYRNSAELKKHVQYVHERPFRCIFWFAGCGQKFGSKNEWKRHVNLQHLHLVCWRCDLSSCKERSAFFNRKDLFGQHLRRMHAPPLKRANKKGELVEKDEEHERWLREDLPKIQDRCFIVIREPPSEGSCEICELTFNGPKNWDAKIEHLGNHYQNDDTPSNGGPFEDKKLIEWALSHQLIEERVPDQESTCKYQFTKHDPYFCKLEGKTAAEDE